jgi:hypothetical protein
MNRPNMYYCAFENTALAMQQLLYILESEDPQDAEKFINSRSSFEEREAVVRVYSLAMSLVEAIDSIPGMEDKL